MAVLWVKHDTEVQKVFCEYTSREFKDWKNKWKTLLINQSNSQFGKNNFGKNRNQIRLVNLIFGFPHLKYLELLNIEQESQFHY